MVAKEPISFWTKRPLANSAGSIQALTYYLWLGFTLTVEALQVYGVDVAAVSVLLAIVALLPGTHDYRRTGRITPVFAWASLSIILLALAAMSLYLRFNR